MLCYVPSVGVPLTIEILFALVLVKFDEHSRSAQTDLAARDALWRRAGDARR